MNKKVFYYFTEFLICCSIIHFSVIAQGNQTVESLQKRVQILQEADKTLADMLIKLSQSSLIKDSDIKLDGEEKNLFNNLEENDKVTLISFIAGNINGKYFTAIGQGIGSKKMGLLQGKVKFSQTFPFQSFTAYLCRTWKCKHHPCFAKEIENGINIYQRSKGNFDAYTLVTYPTGEKLSIISQVRNPDSKHQIVKQTRLGNYSGAIDIVEQLPYEDKIYPAGPGRIIIKGIRQVRRQNGELINIQWEEEVVFVDPSITLSSPQLMVYTPKKTKWDSKTLEFSVTTDVVIKPLKKK